MHNAGAPLRTAPRPAARAARRRARAAAPPLTRRRAAPRQEGCGRLDWRRLVVSLAAVPPAPEAALASLVAQCRAGGHDPWDVPYDFAAALQFWFFLAPEAPRPAHEVPRPAHEAPSTPGPKPHTHAHAQV
jgi:hypothetical protein